MNLYKIKTKSFTAFSMAVDMNTAWDKMQRYLECEDCGSEDDRELVSMELVAITSTSIYNDNKLFI